MFEKSNMFFLLSRSIEVIKVDPPTKDVYYHKTLVDAGTDDSGVGNPVALAIDPGEG